MPAHMCEVTVAVLKPTAVGEVSLPGRVPGAGSRAEVLGHAAPSCSCGEAHSSTAIGGPGGQAVLTSCALQRGLPCPGLSRRCSVQGEGGNKTISFLPSFSQGAEDRQRDRHLSDGSQNRREPCWLCRGSLFLYGNEEFRLMELNHL